MVLVSWAEVVYMWEEFDAENSIFQYTMVAAVDSDDVVYYDELPLRKAEISFQHITTALQLIHDRDVFPNWPSSDLSGTKTLTQAPTQLTTGRVFIKRPKFSHLDVFKRHNVTHLIPQGLLEEARTMEFLSEHPHPHIIRYHGCRSRRGYLTGIVLDFHSNNLRDYLKNQTGTINADLFMNDLESAIHHLHSLGWAHNDLNPTNVLVNDLDPSGNLPILIDFGSARQIGELLGTFRGTSGWIEGPIEDYTVSKRENDIFALEKIRTWLHNPTFNVED